MTTRRPSPPPRSYVGVWLFVGLTIGVIAAVACIGSIVAGVR